MERSSVNLMRPLLGNLAGKISRVTQRIGEQDIKSVTRMCVYIRSRELGDAHAQCRKDDIKKAYLFL